MTGVSFTDSVEKAKARYDPCSGVYYVCVVAFENLELNVVRPGNSRHFKMMEFVVTLLQCSGCECHKDY